MHGELIFNDPQRNEEVRVPGNAVIRDDDTVAWEFHDRELSEGELGEIMEAMEALRRRGERVRLSFVTAGPPLDEVESGPHYDTDHLGPIEYEIAEIGAQRALVELRKA